MCIYISQISSDLKAFPLSSFVEENTISFLTSTKLNQNQADCKMSSKPEDKECATKTANKELLLMVCMAFLLQKYSKR